MERLLMVKSIELMNTKDAKLFSSGAKVIGSKSENDPSPLPEEQQTMLLKVFDELASKVGDDDKSHTVLMFKSSLQSRGIDNNPFQNKIIEVLLESQLNQDFILNQILTETLNASVYGFKMEQPGDFKLVVNDDNQVELTLKRTWLYEPESGGITGKVEADIKVLITPDELLIQSFRLKPSSNDDYTRQAFKYFNENQQGIFQAIMNRLRHLFEGRLKREVTADIKSDDDLWSSASNDDNAFPTSSNH